MSVKKKWITSVLVAAVLAGCGGGKKGARASMPDMTCEEMSARGMELLQAGKRADARLYLRRYEQRCPRGADIAPVKLAICDSFLQESGYELKAEGVALCRQISSFFPNDPVACEAQLRIGDYYFDQMRSCDRDQSETHEAIAEYQKLLQSYPDCEVVSRAEERLQLATERLVCSELGVIEYYMRSGPLRAAEHRLADLLRDYPRFSQRCYAFRLHVEVLSRSFKVDGASQAFAKMSEECSGEDVVEAEKFVMGAPSISGEGTGD